MHPWGTPGRLSQRSKRPPIRIILACALTCSRQMPDQHIINYTDLSWRRSSALFMPAHHSLQTSIFKWNLQLLYTLLFFYHFGIRFSRTVISFVKSVIFFILPVLLKSLITHKNTLLHFEYWQKLYVVHLGSTLYLIIQSDLMTLLLLRKMKNGNLLTLDGSHVMKKCFVL